MALMDLFSDGALHVSIKHTTSDLRGRIFRQTVRMDEPDTSALLPRLCMDWFCGNETNIDLSLFSNRISLPRFHRMFSVALEIECFRCSLRDTMSHLCSTAFSRGLRIVLIRSEAAGSHRAEKAHQLLADSTRCCAKLLPGGNEYELRVARLFCHSFSLKSHRPNTALHPTPLLLKFAAQGNQMKM
jgi:hypothetical protein